jgi:hypothetical protein
MQNWVFFRVGVGEGVTAMHAGDTAPHACAHGVFDIDIACGYKAEYENNHDDDGCGVIFFCLVGCLLQD